MIADPCLHGPGLLSCGHPDCVGFRQYFGSPSAIRYTIADMEDEMLRLRKALAYEARVVEAQTLDLKSLSKCRREQLVRCVERLRRAALDDWPYYGTRHFDNEYAKLQKEGIPQEGG